MLYLTKHIIFNDDIQIQAFQLIVFFFLIEAQISLYQQQMLVLKVYSQFSCSLLSLSIQSMFTHTNKIQPSANAQRSVLATAIIREIIHSKHPTSFNDLSLRDRILQLNPLINNTELKLQIKNELFQIFTTGVQWENIFLDEDSINVSAMEPKRQGQKHRFIFFPTYLSTQQIFKILVQQSDDPYKRTENILLAGGQGMAKTISFRMYTYISHYIHRFYHQAQQNKESRLQFQQLVKQNLICLFPKCFYCSLYNRDVIDQFPRTNFIYLQTTDLPSQKKKILKTKLSNFNEFKKYFSKLYPQNFHKKLIVDHANKFIQQKHNFNHFYNSQIVSGQIHYTSKQPTMAYKYIQSAKSIFTFLHKYKIFGDKLIYVSQINILEDLQKPAKNGQFMINWKFQHTQLESEKILAKQQWAIYVFWQYFWFEIERRLMIKNSQQQVQSMKKIFFEKCIELKVKVKFFYRFRFIKNFFLQKFYQSYFTSKISQKQFQKKISRLISLFIQDITTKMIKQNIQELKKYHRYLLYQFYQQILWLYNQQQREKQERDVDKHLEKWQKQRIINKKQIFPYYDAFKKFNYGNQTKLQLSSYQILQILTQAFFPRVVVNFLNYKGPYQQFYRNAYQRLFSSYIHLCFDLKDNIKLCVKVYEQNEQFYQLADKSQTLLLKIQDCKYNFMSKYFKHYKGIDQKAKIWHIEQIQFEGTCPVIDCAIFYNMYENCQQYVFQTFDFNLSRDPQEIKERKQMAINFFQKVLENNKQYSIQINHIIVCSTKDIPKTISKQQQQKNSGRQFEIYYCDQESIEFPTFGYFQEGIIEDYKRILQILKNIESRCQKNTK